MKSVSLRAGLAGLGALFAVACSEPKAPTAPTVAGPATPEEAILSGYPRQALKLIGFERGPGEELTAAPEDARLIFTIASLDIERWGDAEIAVAGLREPITKELARCYLAGKRNDIDGEKRCREALEAAEAAKRTPDYLSDSAYLGLGASIERNNRLEAAAEVVEGLVRLRPNVRNRKALHAFYDRIGWVKEDVVALEAWAKEMPDDMSVRKQLMASLERKVKGDILEARGAEAEAAAQRLLALEPANGKWRYYLADALELQGKRDEGATERAAAVASGAVAPKAANAVREFAEEAPVPHDHDHQH